MNREITSIQRPKRWDSPFCKEMDDAMVQHVLTHEPFASMDQSRFPQNLSLEGVLKNDCQTRTYNHGEVVLREGDYGHSAFFILSGKVRVILPPGLPDEWLGRHPVEKKSIFRSIAQLWTNDHYPEVRNVDRYQPGNSLQRTENQDETRIFLQDIPGVITKNRSTLLGAGDMFGEVAALSRSQREVTVIVEGDAILLEMRWAALRDIRKWVDEFRLHIDRLYRERSLTHHLRSTELFAHLSTEIIEHIAEQTLFESHGNFEWYKEYQKQNSESKHSTQIDNAPVIVSEGDYPDGLLLIRSGFAQVVKKVNHGFMTMEYLGRGAYFGLDEIIEYSEGGSGSAYHTGLRALGYTDVLRVPTSLIEEHVLPTLPQSKRSDLAKKYKTKQPIIDDKSLPEAPIDTGLLEFLVEHHYINGEATMLIDLDKCTRCDECVVACSKAHNNNPRFNRHGETYDHYMVANACMQCSDPVCMIGCPTGAIHRSATTGTVTINDDTCIGCSVCANACPYDNIRMVPIRDQKGDHILDRDTNVPITKATKCDLCAKQPTGPACQRACPHEALTRMDMHDLPKLAEWLNRK